VELNIKGAYESSTLLIECARWYRGKIGKSRPLPSGGTWSIK